MKSIAIFGAGCGGNAMAADLSLAGFEVHLVELLKFERNLDSIRKRGGINISGSARSGLIMPNMITTDVRRAIENAQVIMFTVPAYGHRTFFDACVPFLKDGQIVVFNTGYYAGIRFGQELKRLGKNVIVAETPSLVYLCRLTGPAQVFVDGLKRSLQIAAFRASDTDTVIDVLKDAYPQLTPASNVLETSLSNQNAIFHIPVYLTNIGCLERDRLELSLTVKEAVTPSVAKMMDLMDGEREALANVLGIEVLPIGESITSYYGTLGGSTHELVQNCVPYRTYTYTFENGTNSYVREDWAFGLVPMASLGEQLGVQMPMIQSLIKMGSAIDGVDYWSEGLTVNALGLKGLDSRQIVKFVTKGDSTIG